MPAPLTEAHEPLVLAPVATLQALQAPLQALLQQNPSTQKLERHCEAKVQEFPLGWGPVQLAPMHTVPPPHWVLTPQEVGQVTAP